MEMNMKDEIKRLVDEIPDSELQAARRFLEFLRHQSRSALAWALEAAPIDDEPYTDDEKEAVAEAREEVKAGRIVLHDEIRRELGQ